MTTFGPGDDTPDEAALPKLADRFRWSDDIGVSVIATDADGVVAWWNRGAERTFGWSAAEAVGASMLALTTPLLAEAEDADIRAEVLAGRTWAGEFLLRRRDGSVFPAVVTDSPVFDEAGRLAGIARLTVELSNRDTAPLDWYRSVVDHASDLIVVLDTEARLVYASAAIETLLGHRPADIVGRPCWEYIDERDFDVVAHGLADAFTDDHSQIVLFRARHADGGVRWFEALANRLEEQGGVGVVVVGRDVHDREVAADAAREAQRRAEASEAQLRAVLEASPFALVAFDAEGTCTAVAGQLFNGETLPTPAVGSSIADLGEQLGFCAAQYRRRMANGERFVQEVQCRGRVLQLHHATMRGADGEPVGGVVVATEVTGERRAQEALEQHDARFRALVQRSADAALIADESGAIVWASPAVKEVFGYEPDEVVGNLGFDFVHPDDVAHVASRYDELLGGRPQAPLEMRIRTADGSWCWVEEQLTNLLDEPAVAGVVANLRDITERRRASEAVAASEQRYRTIVESAGEGICIFDGEGRVVVANPRLRSMLRIEADPKSLFDFVHPDDLHLAMEGYARRCSGESYHAEVRFVRSDGETVHVLVTANPLRGADDRIEGGVLMLTDITERKRAEEELARLALTDLVTGLPNRALILDRLEHALARAQRYRHRVAVMFLDVDQFKLVNDSFGHFVGDELLRAIAGRLTDAVRSGDTTIGRLGGDEFVVLCEGLENDSDAVGIATRIHDALADPFRVGTHELYVTVSLGVAIGPPGDPDTLLSHADAAMYRAKQTGRARTELFDDELREAARERLQLLTELRAAIEHGQLVLEYQPVLDLASGQVTGVEALVRWQHPTRGTIPPAAFIGAAEDSGLIVAMGAEVLQMALRQAAIWDEQGLHLTMSVNLSPKQISDPSLVERISSALRESRFDPGRLCLEITEGALMEDVNAAVEVMGQLRQLGASLAIDDFGTGYSSLTYLSRLPVDTLKIDRSFIAPLPDEGEAIVEAITRLAAAIGVLTVAEGVETPGQAQAAQRLGCAAAQGYLWSRPVPAEQVPDVIERIARSAGAEQAP